jgi:hypothetical protein
VRAYARRRLDDVEGLRGRTRHAAYFTRPSSTAEPGYFCSSGAVARFLRRERQSARRS